MQRGRRFFRVTLVVADLLNVYAPLFAAPPLPYRTIHVPANAKSGAYTIRVGVCRTQDAERLRVRQTPLPVKTRAVSLPVPLTVAAP